MRVKDLKDKINCLPDDLEVMNGCGVEAFSYPNFSTANVIKNILTDEWEIMFKFNLNAMTEDQIDEMYGTKPEIKEVLIFWRDD